MTQPIFTCLAAATLIVTLVAGTADAQLALSPAADAGTSAATASGSTSSASRRFKLKPTLEAQRIARGHRGNGTKFGDPVQGLSRAQLAVFEAGQEEFESIETPEGGLGPIFNGNACAACHSAGAVGGASDITVTRFGRRLPSGEFDPLTALGGTLLHEKTTDPRLQEMVPAEANVIAKRLSTPLFGAGLVEGIPDQDILNNAQRRKPEGISGRASMVTDLVTGQQRVGHFGWKGQHASLLAFASDAYLNEMGITSRFLPKNVPPNGNAALLAQYLPKDENEDVVDPVTGKGDIDASADFATLLGPPPPLRATESTLAGGRLFQQAQCAACHTPVMFSGPNKVEALAHKPVPLYSDLLLHDMGSLGDGIVQGTAGATEMKTAPLWGLRVRGTFLHDGRAKTVAEAIRAHDGEGAESARRFNRLSDKEQRQLIDFLMSI